LPSEPGFIHDKAPGWQAAGRTRFEGRASLFHAKLAIADFFNRHLETSPPFRRDTMVKRGFHARILAPVVLLTAGLVGPGLGDRALAGENNEAGVRIGMVNSLFRDVPEATLSAMMKPFSSVMEAQTGVRGELIPGGEMNVLGDQMAADKIQLGVFHGIEFAWVRLKHPELKPLAIAVNQNRHVRALLVVRVDNPAADALQLHDQVLAMPQQSKLHCHLFADKCCDASHKRACQFFSKVATPANAEEALDDVVDKEVSAVIVDAVAFESFKRRKPGRAAKLRIVLTSDVFPTAVIAYKPGAVDEATAAKFRDGLLGASHSILGRQMLTLWKLTGFEAIPNDYEATLSDIVKAYPPPAFGK
jgi:ABC-type phosphate/phosphonate transport system substrate-binding protein